MSPLREPLARAIHAHYHRRVSVSLDQCTGGYLDRRDADAILATLANDPETLAALAQAIAEYGETDSVSGTAAALFGDPS